MATDDRSGNFVSEWFGQRIFPEVRIDVAAVSPDSGGPCPFLSDALRRRERCVKSENSSGVCTVSSASNGHRQDWLVCPYRVINSHLVARACQLIFGLAEPVQPVPASLLGDPSELARLVERIKSDAVGYVFFQDKLGGEISVTGSHRSPEMAFDITVAEIRSRPEGGFHVARYGILEVQTMDYHGTYRHAVRNLREGLRLHRETFPDALQIHLKRWSGEQVEGPNIANVFKRTFYQMLLKSRLAGPNSAAAGTVLAIPQAVWDSWQPFLGAPETEDESPSVKRLRVAPGSPVEPPLNAYICIFDIDAQNPAPISPIVIRHFIRVSPERMTHHAFTEVPAHMLHSIQAEDSILMTIRSRLGEWWPAFQMRNSRSRKKPAP